MSFDENFIFIISTPNFIFREHRDTKNGSGKLKTSVANSRHYPLVKTENGLTKFTFGDSRGDVHPAFTALHTVILRVHNQIAEKLAVVNPQWNDEKLYQETRKIIGGVMQHITYTQFMNALLGVGNAVAVPESGLQEDFYDPEVDGSIDIVFSTAAYR